ncbi:MAG: hypothetical protein GXP08_18480 [Gammaproteobacteria bacterium]|nr:hypothetical protein [Gammaproteobacteria bacterium]
MAITPPGLNLPVSEHDPQWREAILKIEEVLKGSPSDKNVTLLSPGTMDVAWIDVPRFNVDQQGIFLLNRVEQKNAVSALSPLDIHPKDQ